MDGFFGVSDWRRYKQRRNGFILLEMFLAVSLGAMILSAIVPLLTETVRNDQRQVMAEEVLRQGIVMDESLYYTLRYSRIISVSPTEIHFYDSDNTRAGFMVQQNVVYRILSNKQKQPLTGTQYNTLVRGQVLALPYEGRPYFSDDGKCIYIAVLLEDAATGARYPCVMTVVPWQREQADG